MSRAFGIQDIVAAMRAVKFMKSKLTSKSKFLTSFPDRVLVHVFSYLRLVDLCRVARVCKRWRQLAYDGRLWTRISLRPDYSGLYVRSVEVLLGLIGVRFAASLKYIEISVELIIPAVLHDLATKCSNLKHMTLDFSKAVQLRDFSDLAYFPCNLHSLTICLSEIIFMEGFMRRVYHHLSSIEVLHLIGTFELDEEDVGELYEVINIAKIKTQTPHLTLINLYGINFVDDSHVETLSSNCIHLECLSLNFCIRVRGSTLPTLMSKCMKLRTLLLQHCALENEYMEKVDWESSKVHELDLTSTDLSHKCLMNILCRMPGFTFLALGHCEFFNDADKLKNILRAFSCGHIPRDRYILQMRAKLSKFRKHAFECLDIFELNFYIKNILMAMMELGKLDNIRAIDLSHTHNLSEAALMQLFRYRGNRLEGLIIAGKAHLGEQFFLNCIPLLKKIRILSCGFADGWFLRKNALEEFTRLIHMDQLIVSLAQNCERLENFEAQWDSDMIRFSENSSKFIDQLRMRCPSMRTMTLSDGEYYEMVKSNFERADRKTVVRSTTSYVTSIATMLSRYRDLQFN